MTARDTETETGAGLLLRAARRASTRPQFMAWLLARFQEQHGFIWDQRNETPGRALEPTFHCGGCVAKAGGAPPHSMPLDLFMVSLMNNIQLPPGVLESAGRNLRTPASA